MANTTSSAKGSFTANLMRKHKLLHVSSVLLFSPNPAHAFSDPYALLSASVKTLLLCLNFLCSAHLAHQTLRYHFLR